MMNAAEESDENVKQWDGKHFAGREKGLLPG